MKVSFVDLVSQHEEVADEVRAGLEEVFATNRLRRRSPTWLPSSRSTPRTSGRGTASEWPTAPTRSSSPCERSEWARAER